jgi:hypothetical protein
LQLNFHSFDISDLTALKSSFVAISFELLRGYAGVLNAAMSAEKMLQILNAALN